ncbi:MAG: CHASE2 domain-containing protein, partial [Leptolyngbya sp. SIO4C1]|nr:CHASE2 domain-containing protein [Leptolyngbya sp. SIO4C1]
GIDLYRDFPASTPDLAETLTQPNIIGVCKSRDPAADTRGIGPAPEMTVTQVGFSDFIEEIDGVLRRQLLTLTPDPVSPCTAMYGFAALIAIHYLQGDNIQPSFTPQGSLQLGDTIFPRLDGRTGGLQRFDSRGNQLLLNYRAQPSPDQLVAKVPLQQLLNGEVNPASIRDRIVLIGVVGTSGDYWSTPYGVQAQDRTPGVFLQAQMISQLISAVLEARSLIWVWPQWAEASCVAMVAIMGSLLAWQWQSTRLGIAYLLAVGGLVGGAWATFLIGGWLPLVPALLALSGGTLSTKLLTRLSTQSEHTG